VKPLSSGVPTEGANGGYWPAEPVPSGVGTHTGAAGAHEQRSTCGALTEWQRKHSHAALAGCVGMLVPVVVIVPPELAIGHGATWAPGG